MMLRLLLSSALFISLLLLDVAGQSSQWTGCVNPDDLTIEDLVTIGEQHSICLTIGPGGDWSGISDGNGKYKGITYLRYTWRVKGDEYSRFHIPNCKYHQFGNHIKFSAAWNTANQFPRANCSKNLLFLLFSWIHSLQ